MTQRVIRAVENPFVTMLAHPTGRLLLKREAYHIDIPVVLNAAAAPARGSNSTRTQAARLDWRWWPLAKQKAFKCVINPDAHRTARCKICGSGSVSPAKAGLPKTMW
jgi:DNA polymerase (family 10)